MSEPIQIEEPEAQVAGWTRADVLALAGIVVFCLIFFREALFTAAPNCLGTPSGDGRTQFFCWRVYGFGRLAEGEFPLWNPYVFLGMPFVANLQSAMFYPTNYLWLILPYAQAANWGILINLVLGGFFAYALGRELGMRWPGATATALTFMFAAPQFLRIYEGHWVHLCAIPWIPALFLCTEKLLKTPKLKYALLGGCAVALQMFSGHPQYLFYTGIAVALYFLVRIVLIAVEARRKRPAAPDSACAITPLLGRRIALFCLLYLGGVLLSAVQLIPALELLSQSSRQGRLDFNWIAQYSLPPENLLTMLVPDLFGVGPGVTYWGKFNVWEMSAYMGIVSFVLMLLAVVRVRRRAVWIFGGLGIALIVLALGRHTPLLRILYQTVPGFDLFRGVARFLAPASLCLAVLAGFGADAFISQPRGGWIRRGIVPRRDLPRRVTHGRTRPAVAQLRRLLAGRSDMAVLLGCALLLGGAALICGPYGSRMPGCWVGFFNWSIRQGCRVPAYLSKDEVTPLLAESAWFAATRSLLISALLVCALGAVYSVGRTVPKQFGKPMLVIGLFALMAADALAFGQRYLVTFDASKWAWPQPIGRFLQEQQPARVAAPATWKIGPCDGMMYRVACLEGIEPNVPRRFHEVFWTSQDPRKLDSQRSNYPVIRASPLLNMLSLKYLILARPLPRDAQGVREIPQAGRIRLYENTDALPRAFVVHEFTTRPNPQSALAALQQIVARKVAVLEPRQALAVPPLPPPGPRTKHPPVVFEEYSPERIVMRVETPLPGLLILSDLYYPGWRATVQGQPAPIQRANYLLRAIPVNAGEQRVELTYSPRSIKLGAWISALGWLAVLAGGFALRLRGPKATESEEEANAH